MKIYCDGKEYFTEFDNVPANAKLFVDEPFSEGAFRLLECTAKDFVTILAMFEEEGTCFENVIEEWQNEEEFVMNHNIYVGDIATLPNLIKRCRSHAVYFTYEEFAEYVKELALEWDYSEEDVGKVLNEDMCLAKLSKIPGIGGYSSCGG